MSVLIGEFVARYTVSSPYDKTGDDDNFTSKRNFATMRCMKEEFSSIKSNISKMVNYRRETRPRIDTCARTKDEREGVSKTGFKPVYENDRTINSFELEYVMHKLYFSEMSNIFGIGYHEYPHDNLEDYNQMYMNVPK